ncbi:hypothetical protein L0665_02370 [Methanogenium marinum]|uniref:Uncharacterized protein n=1 Tax=Methanogenium marinum TaxID=348610 RepID=A0A9Q4KSN6_9EURY|nr:hypothetical protein [Methanogenium marinum]MDE4907463.1 hypothetical protein [Methanogenium marinum]
MEKSTQIMIAIAGLAVVCVCAAVVLPFVMGNDNEIGSVSTVSYETVPADEPEVVSTVSYETVAADESVNTIGADSSAPEGMAPEGMPEMDAEQIQEMLDMMQADGIDTTDAEAALEDGDMDAFMAFIQENQPANGGAGERQDGLPPQQ